MPTLTLTIALTNTPTSTSTSSSTSTFTSTSPVLYSTLPCSTLLYPTLLYLLYSTLRYYPTLPRWFLAQFFLLSGKLRVAALLLFFRKKKLDAALAAIGPSKWHCLKKNMLWKFVVNRQFAKLPGGKPSNLWITWSRRHSSKMITQTTLVKPPIFGG